MCTSILTLSKPLASGKKVFLLEGYKTTGFDDTLAKNTVLFVSWVRNTISLLFLLTFKFDSVVYATLMMEVSERTYLIHPEQQQQRY